MSVDPRIALELEKLNNSCEKINNLELKLDEMKRNYQEIQEKSEEEIQIISSKTKNAIDLARPFYEARRQTNEYLKQLKIDSLNLEKSKTNLAAAKEMVFLAEQNAKEGCLLDMALQEMISHGISRVNQYTEECNRMQNKLRVTELKYEMSVIQATKLQTQLKSSIKVSRPYYEIRSNCNMKLRNMKIKMGEMENDIQKTKAAYNDALQNLEKISDEIHKLREEQKLRGSLDSEDEQSDVCVEKFSSNCPILRYQRSLSDDYEMINSDDKGRNSNGESSLPTPEWSDIPLNSISKSNSSNSCFSQNSNGTDLDTSRDKKHEDASKNGTTVFGDWISKSSFRRQSFEDVFTQSNLFGKFGRERRNSFNETSSLESPPAASSSKKEFFFFGRQEDLTDSQIESLFLSPDNL